MELQTVYDNFILSRQLMDLSPATIKDYQNFLMPFVGSVGAKKPIETIQQEDITNYISNLLKKPLSKATRSTYIRNVKIFLRWACQEYHVQYDYSKIKIPRSPRREVRIYSPDDIQLIFSTCQTDLEWLTARNKAVLALMYDSGLRLSEVCTLRHKNVMFKECRMIVHGKGDKERTVPIGQLTQRYLQHYLELCPYRSDSVFMTRYGKPLSTNSVKLMVSRLASVLPFDLSCHKLRHNYATNYCLDQYEKQGQVDIYHLMYLMGHEDVATTRRYLHFAYEIIAGKGSVSHLDKLSGLL